MLVEDIAKQIGLQHHLCGEALDKLAVLFGVIALDGHDQVVSLLGKFPLEGEKIPLIFEIFADQVIPVRVELQKETRHHHAGAEQGDLGPNKPVGPVDDHRRNLAQEPRQKGVAG